MRRQRRDKDRAPLTAEELRDLVSYDSDTGVMIWRRKRYRAAAGHQVGCFSHGYRTVKLKQEMLRVHRLIWLYVYGRWPTHIIDHINGNPADNRLCNLREATQTQNSHNMRPRRGPGTVGAVQNKNGWQVQIRVDGRQVYLGRFRTQEEAHAAYIAKARETRGEFARID